MKELEREQSSAPPLENRRYPTWSLVIATFNRRKDLVDTIQSVLEQEPLPMEVVIVDCSDDWKPTQSAIAQMLVDTGIPLVYEHSIRKSLTHQRNIGIDKARGEVLFMLDDDAPICPGCMKRLLGVFADDLNEQVIGVSATEVKECANSNPSVDQQNHKSGQPRQGVLERWWHGQHTQEKYFAPYDTSDRQHRLSDLDFDTTGLVLEHWIGGGRSAWRAGLFEKERFEDRLVRYCVFEDADFGCRASRHGYVVRAYDAHHTHRQSPEQRMPPSLVEQMRVMNHFGLHRIHGDSRSRSAGCLIRYAMTLCFMNFVRDCKRVNYKLSRTRGSLKGFFYSLRYLTRSTETLNEIFARDQRMFESKLSRK